MVFAIATAAALYVASSVFSAKIKAETYADYSRQRIFLQKSLERVTMDAMRLSYESGYGISDSDMWYVYRTSLSPDYIERTNSPYTQGEKWAYDPEYTIELYAEALAGEKEIQIQQQQQQAQGQNGVVPRSDAWSNINSWKLGVVDHLDATPHSTRYFNAYTADNSLKMPLSEFLMTPGWRAIRNKNLNRYDDDIGMRGVDSNDDAFDFVRINEAGFPSDLIQRKDLPFNQSSGWARALRMRYRYDLAADDSATLGHPEVAAWTDPVWVVEEPVTNYQLVLLDKKDPDTDWLSSGSKKVSIGNSGASGENVGKMLAVGPVDLSTTYLGAKTVGAVREQVPFAMLVNNGDLNNSNQTGLEVRHLPNTGFLGFGNGAAPSNVLSSGASTGVDGSSPAALRHFEISQAQSMHSPSMLFGNNTIAWGDDQAWVNPVFWTFAIANNWVLGITRPLTIGGMVTAQVDGNSFTATDPRPEINGNKLSGLKFYKDGLGKKVAELDLDIFNPESVLDPSDRIFGVYPWMAPIEIHILRDNTLPYLSYDRLIIKGSTDINNPLNNKPIKIVTSVTDIDFSTHLNYRRFILVSKGYRNQSALAILNFPIPSSTWYGALFGASGFKVTGYPSSGVNWYGSIVCASEFNAYTGLTIRPDDGKGLNDTGLYSDKDAIHNMLAPLYEHADNAIAGRPMPMRAPSLLWIFR